MSAPVSRLCMMDFFLSHFVATKNVGSRMHLDGLILSLENELNTKDFHNFGYFLVRYFPTMYTCIH